LKLPGGKKQADGETRVVSPIGYDERECYDCLVEMEGLLGNCIASARKAKKARRKTVAPSSGPKSARDVIAYGMRQGWIQ
jgi:serine/threonine-protein kinase haspin